MVAVCLITGLVWLNISVERNKLGLIEESLSSYMTHLKNMIFSSTFDSLKKGNMKVFNNILKEIGSYEYVYEFSLLSPDGKITFSSDDAKAGRTDKNVIGVKKEKVLKNVSNITYYFPVQTVSYCTRCHIDWPLGEINSYYKVVLSRQALVNISKFSKSTYQTAIFSGIIVFIFFYLFYYIVKNKVSEDNAKENERLFRSLFENIMDVQYKTDINGNLTLISPSGIRLLGYDNEDEMKRFGAGQIMFYDLSERHRFLKILAKEGSVKNYEIKLRKKDNTPVVVEMNTRVIYDNLRNPISIEGVFRDITYRKEYEKQLNLMGIIFDTAVESIVIANSKCVIDKVNPAFSDTTGFRPQEVIGRTPLVFRSDKHERSFYHGMHKELFRNGRWTGEIWNKKASGEVYPEWVSITVIKDEQGNISHYISVSHDITEQKKSEEQLKHQAYHDALTKLPNRELFNDRLEVALAYCQRHEKQLAVLFIDLDNFKQVNDTAGHQVGDVYLKTIATILKDSCREEDTVARIGGDEFAVLLPDADGRESAEMVAQRIFKLFTKTVEISGYKMSPSASIGIALFPDDGSSGVDLLKAADMAMYYAKEQGKSDYAFYNPTMNTSDVDMLELESNIAYGIDNNEFIMYYQPVVSLKDMKIKGFESLIRWVKPDGRMVMPCEYIEEAEKLQIIHRLGDYVLEKTCTFMEKMNSMGYGNLSFSVNVASRQFQNPKFVENAISIVKKKDIRPHKLILEITENTVIQNINVAIKTMKELKSYGMRLSLDDFGTGYSSLAYLKEFPISILKIDRTFTKGILENQNEQHITDSIVSLAKNFKMLVIAEGVEEKEQARYLQNIDCDFIQGYYFSKPLSEEDVLKLLSNDPTLEI